MDFDVITDVVEAYNQFQISIAPGKKSTLVDFGVWVNTQDYSKGKSADSGHAEIIGRNDIDAELGKLIIYLNRYTRLIIKKGLADFPELISRDFTRRQTYPLRKATIIYIT